MIKTLTRPALRNARRPVFAAVASETLEDRVVLSAVSAAPPAPNLQAPLAEVTDVVVNSVELFEGQLVANATVVGNVLGHDFTQDVQIPLNLGATDGGDGACDILNLSLGPVSLNVLGLNINLDDCAGGPVAVDITGNEAPGNLLGNLLCDVAGLLDSDGLLDLSSLTGDQLDTLTSGLTDVLNGVFDELLAPGGGATAAAAAQAASSTDILNLHLNAINLNLLGLEVQTSDICLDVTADSGNGNLLGNLLGSIAHLLDRNPGNAINALLNRAEQILASLDLGEVSDALLASQGNGKK
jgi:hypothetical protein